MLPLPVQTHINTIITHPLPTPDPHFVLLILNTESPHFNPQSLPFVSSLWSSCGVRVCADGGANWLYDNLGPTYLPDLLAGDLDSVRPEICEIYEKNKVEMFRNNSDSDHDMGKSLTMICKKWNVNKTMSLIVFNAFGGRFDQEMANLNTGLKYAKNFKRVLFVSDTTIAEILSPNVRHLCMPEKGKGEGPVCGMIPLFGACPAVSTMGLRWDVQNQEMKFGGMVSSSNELTAKDEMSYNQVEIVTFGIPLLWTMTFTPGMVAKDSKRHDNGRVAAPRVVQKSNAVAVSPPLTANERTNETVVSSAESSLGSAPVSANKRDRKKAADATKAAQAANTVKSESSEQLPPPFVLPEQKQSDNSPNSTTTNERRKSKSNTTPSDSKTSQTSVSSLPPVQITPTQHAPSRGSRNPAFASADSAPAEAAGLSAAAYRRNLPRSSPRRSGSAPPKSTRVSESFVEVSTPISSGGGGGGNEEFPNALEKKALTAQLPGARSPSQRSLTVRGFTTKPDYKAFKAFFLKFGKVAKCIPRFYGKSLSAGNLLVIFNDPAAKPRALAAPPSELKFGDDTLILS